jgi:ketosteroid isomerase-like protein
MQRILLLPLLIVALVGHARAQGTTGNQADREIEKEILKLEDERNEAMQKGDVTVLDRILADDLAFVNTRGELHTKADRLADYRSGVIKYLSFKQDQYRLHVYGDTVVMTGRASGAVEYHGKVNRQARTFTNVYIKQGGQWHLVAHQATPIAEQ